MSYLESLPEAELLDVVESYYNNYSTMRRFADYAALPIPLTHSEIEILHFVSTHPGTEVSTIARARLLRPSNVSVTLQALLTQGLISREPSQKDRRIQHHFISADGQKVIDDVIVSWAKSIHTILSEMNDISAQKVLNAMSQLTPLTEITEELMKQLPPLTMTRHYN